jgi:predicted amidohydrolase
MAKLNLATCQFLIHKDPERNVEAVLRQIEEAKAGGAHLVHFSEACVSGYLGVEVESVRDSDWDGIENAMTQILAAARRYRIWVVIGCNHKLTGRHRPHNSLYVINPKGELVDRYDKRFCTGDNARTGDLKHYSPGEKFVTFDVRGVRCGLLICHDFRYPELFREYKKRGVQLMLVSFHNAGMTKEAVERYKVYVATTMQAAAASNYFAVSANNGTRRYAWASFVANAEGLIVDKAPAHRPAVLLNTIDTTEKLYDASVAWRGRCMRGLFNSGTVVKKDPRSSRRTSL